MDMDEDGNLLGVFGVKEWTFTNRDHHEWRLRVQAVDDFMGLESPGSARDVGRNAR